MNATRSDFKSADAPSYDEHIGDFKRFTIMLTAPLARHLITMAQKLVVGVGSAPSGLSRRGLAHLIGLVPDLIAVWARGAQWRQPDRY